jgi:hypothetical protein
MLSAPKHDYDPQNIFTHSDFRGLLHADYGEAINNAGPKIRSAFSKTIMMNTNSSFGTI